jgi:hydrogenase 3 maturation protease
VAILGIGHELRGDDAAGILIARALMRSVAELRHILVIDAGHAPENFSGPLRRFSPDLILLIDAAQMGEAPGTIRWLAWDETAGLSASTHTLPLWVLAKYLIAELGCEIALITIQALDASLGRQITIQVQQSIDTIVHSLAEQLSFTQSSQPLGVNYSR